MKLIEEVSIYISKIIGIDSEYIKLTIATILIFVLFGILKSIIK